MITLYKKLTQIHLTLRNLSYSSKSQKPLPFFLIILSTQVFIRMKLIP